MQRVILGFLLSISVCAQVAAAPAVVEGVQMPAWLQRNQTVTALRAGTELTSTDVIRTGQRGRVLLHLEEGSQVKLGADAVLELEELTPPTATATPRTWSRWRSMGSNGFASSLES